MIEGEALFEVTGKAKICYIGYLWFFPVSFCEMVIVIAIAPTGNTPASYSNPK